MKYVYVIYVVFMFFVVILILKKLRYYLDVQNHKDADLFLEIRQISKIQTACRWCILNNPESGGSNLV